MTALQVTQREDAEETDIPLSSESIGGRLLCNLRFAYRNIIIIIIIIADDVDLLGGSEEELPQLNERLEKATAGYGMEISSNKRKILVNSIKPHLTTNIWMNGKTLEKWTSSNT